MGVSGHGRILTRKALAEGWPYLVMVLPGFVLFYMLFCYVPMYGITIGFKEFTYGKGMAGSPWVGLQYFRYLFTLSEYRAALKNTVVISLGRLLIEFPIPILISLMLNELRSRKLQRTCQTVFTFPYFISWIVAYGMFFNLLSTDGTLNRIISAITGDTVNFLGHPTRFLGLIFISNIWKNMGWNTILYLAAIAGINPELYEAAYADGAGRFRRILHITLPSLLPTISILLLLQVGNTMNAGFDQIFNMYSPPVYETADIVDTLVYRLGFNAYGGFSLATAAGLIKSLINFVLLFGADRVVKLSGQAGIF